MYFSSPSSWFWCRSIKMGKSFLTKQKYKYLNTSAISKRGKWTRKDGEKLRVRKYFLEFYLIQIFLKHLSAKSSWIFKYIFFLTFDVDSLEKFWKFKNILKNFEEKVLCVLKYSKLKLAFIFSKA